MVSYFWNYFQTLHEHNSFLFYFTLIYSEPKPVAAEEEDDGQEDPKPAGNPRQ